ncbi:kinase-like protein [Cylindrobasidium torrendii FP15055 ss-10]|uniref:Kinase-like protein n=1 Tax=Cylindrobasidium torrendii FP15055 ss-10 TaxID=1314674 RepID=A0A0D7BGZ1_9AGAR|nr:kinase-like protein [Cylindrobasidium torrendii FP15055 ss-10]
MSTNIVSTLFHRSPPSTAHTSKPSSSAFKLRVKLVPKTNLKLVPRALAVPFTRQSSRNSASEKSVTPTHTTASQKSPPPLLPLPVDGDVLVKRYTLLRKLGKGGFSTVWLARDAQTGLDVAIKIPTRQLRTREVDKLRLLPETGVPLQLNRMLHHFPYAPDTHCIVLDLLGPTLDDLQYHFGMRRLPKPIVQQLTADMLTALEFLHGLGIVHTDIQPRNILLSKPDAFMCDAGQWRFVLADLGNAVRLPHSTTRPASPNIQPHALRAPEVILSDSWGTGVDIWNLGCLVYEFIVGGPLFSPFFTGDGYEGMTPAQVHMLQIIEQVGEPPRRLRHTSFFDETGKLRCPFPTQRTSLKALVGLVWKDPEEVTKFVEFLKRMLTVDPDERWTAAALLAHPWLTIQSDMGTLTVPAAEHVTDAIDSPITTPASATSTRSPSKEEYQVSPASIPLPPSPTLESLTPLSSIQSLPPLTTLSFSPTSSPPTTPTSPHTTNLIRQPTVYMSANSTFSTDTICAPPEYAPPHSPAMDQACTL